MASKKLAATLGTGTLGASGAAAAAALNMGNKSRNEDSQSLDIDPSPDTKEQQGEPAREPQTGANEKQKIDSGSQSGGQAPTTKSPFVGAGNWDIKAFNSNNWSAQEPKNDEITIKVEEGGESWQCTIKGVVFDNDQSKRDSINNQVKEFVEKIKREEEMKKKFVKNCADSRLTKEKAEGKESTIELEVEKSNGEAKLKDLDKLLNGDFMGLARFDLDYHTDHRDAEENWFKVEQEDKKVVVKMLSSSNELICSVYGFGEYGGTKIDSSNFDHGNLSSIFYGNSHTGVQMMDESVALANFEKRKFFKRNCSKYNEKIEGMKVVFDSNSKKWKFENLEELLLTKMYDNPKPEKPLKPGAA